jgi:pimeloyl-ACP methyl ester carboxylesterase
MNPSNTSSLAALPLPQGIRSRVVSGINGLDVHLLEAGHAEQPALLLLHGFPELAYSWRKQMLPLAAAGYHVIAPDQRGFGRTTGWDAAYDADLRDFARPNLVRDALGLVMALGHRQVAAVIGHDSGSIGAAWCALLRPDVFRSVVLMSAPFGGPPELPELAAGKVSPDVGLHAALAAMHPPRKHYQHYYSGREANADMWHAPQGLPALLRAYYHCKSADWKANKPFALASWSAEDMARLPRYYVMDLDQGMAQTAAAMAPTPAEAAACTWLSDAELAVYAAEFGRTGFQGGLQWYRCASDARCLSMLQLFAGRRIDVPAVYIAGAADWGMHQKPGELQRMQQLACSQFRGMHVVDGAGHWVQQEQPEQTARLLLQFLGSLPVRS